ncbi:hypothetical protein CDD81_7443 [Ophiocordyceps australis]|uniref:Phospholipase/carboxylesterase/thioesterase domain-containing protein n=1 Tax=Ophiocordyceps australis TaxID=1399860 RepID=A0A2C5XLG0_9HYPO|nr:hypothetical protein CDD81_7443 [Ophiocordyceps australis]
MAAACHRHPHLSTAFVVRPSAPHTHTVILLHDVASNGVMFGRDLMRLGKTSSDKTLDWLFPGVRFVFPSSPRLPCLAMHQMRLSLWFDVARLDDPSFRQDIQRQGLCASTRHIVVLLHWEMRLVPADKIIIGGLGQGCALSLVLLLSLGYPIGGIIGMSGFLPFQFELEMNTVDHTGYRDIDDGHDDDNELYDSDFDQDDSDYDSQSEDSDEYQVDDDNDDGDDDDDDQVPQDPIVSAQIFERTLLQINSREYPCKEKTSYGTPIFLGHGVQDGSIPHSMGQKAAGAMRSVEYEVEWRSYKELGHGYKVPAEIDDIVEFIRSKVGLEPRRH